MTFRESYFHCGDLLKQNLASEIEEIHSAVGQVLWQPDFSVEREWRVLEHQTAYNKALAIEFERLGWEPQPVLRSSPRLVGDFRKNLVFVEVQFGNSATLYRDYYKFQYGLANGLLSLAVLVVPESAADFFPTRPRSVANMAEFQLAETYLTILPIRVPTLLIGLLPSN